MPEGAGGKGEDDVCRPAICRLIGRPGRVAALKRFILTMSKPRQDSGCAPHRHLPPFWRRINISPQRLQRCVPSRMDGRASSGLFSGIFEHSPWIAGALRGSWNWAPRPLTAPANFYSAALSARPAKPGVWCADRPPRPCRQAGAGQTPDLNRPPNGVPRRAGRTDRRGRRTFTRLNLAYVEKFGFPFIIAVKDNTKALFLAAFQTPASTTTFGSRRPASLRSGASYTASETILLRNPIMDMTAMPRNAPITLRKAVCRQSDPDHRPRRLHGCLCGRYAEFSDIVASYLPFWDQKTRLWVIARPLSGCRNLLILHHLGAAGRRRPA